MPSVAKVKPMLRAASHCGIASAYTAAVPWPPAKPPGSMTMNSSRRSVNTKVSKATPTHSTTPYCMNSEPRL